MITNPPGESAWIQRGERVHRRLVVVAVEAHHRERLDRSVGEGVLEPADEELHSIVE